MPIAGKAVGLVTAGILTVSAIGYSGSDYKDTIKNNIVALEKQVYLIKDEREAIIEISNVRMVEKNKMIEQLDQEIKELQNENTLLMEELEKSRAEGVDIPVTQPENELPEQAEPKESIDTEQDPNEKEGSSSQPDQKDDVENPTVANEVEQELNGEQLDE